ncbi:hypothetical protein R1flu_015941 [Riccia fluitans]|uniref:Uncharacterized protein n=1 Tax=Riccia fluitans TaxID=41844 RepID=A0ABD1YL80_9MARC
MLELEKAKHSVITEDLELEPKYWSNLPQELLERVLVVTLRTYRWTACLHFSTQKRAHGRRLLSPSSSTAIVL